MSFRRDVIKYMFVGPDLFFNEGESVFLNAV